MKSFISDNYIAHICVGQSDTLKLVLSLVICTIIENTPNTWYFSVFELQVIKIFAAIRRICVIYSHHNLWYKVI